MTKIPELEEMLKGGVHFGHQSSKRHPNMKPFIYSVRNQINIIDLEKTTEQLKKAAEFLTKIVTAGGTVLFISSKKQAKALIEKHAKDCAMPYINSRWLGGTFTNFGNIIKLTKKLKNLEKKMASGEMDKYTKKEQLEFQKEITKLSELVGGIKDMEKLPEAVFVVDIKKDKTAVREAKKKKIPAVALVDTNVNPEDIKYPIPANDDAAKSIEMFISFLAETIKEARTQIPTTSEDLNNITK